MFIEKRLELIEQQLERIESMLTGGVSPTVRHRPLAVDIKEASRLIGVGLNNTRKMYKQGILKGHHEGKKIMIIMKSIEDFIEWQASR
jgi:hypothetical protein